MDTPLKGTSPNMVAAGTSLGPGATTQNVMAQFFGTGYAIPVWRMRDGRNKTFALWDDFFSDALTAIGLKRSSIYEPPPVRPQASSAVFGEAYALWIAATTQFQTEGSILFDLVKASLDLSGAHADQDLRRLRAWKHEGIKDGRALARWALTFVDRSTVEGQMSLLTEIHSLSLSAKETLLGLLGHTPPASQQHQWQKVRLGGALEQAQRRGPPPRDAGDADGGGGGGGGGNGGGGGDLPFMPDHDEQDQKK